MVLPNPWKTHRTRNEMKSTGKPLARPGGNPPARAGLTHHRKRALVGASETTPSSVGSEPQSPVNEPRKKDGRGSLRVSDSGDNTEAPQWSGVEVRPGSKSWAEWNWGLQGSWEGLLPPRQGAGKGSARQNKIPDRERALGPWSPRKREKTEVSDAEFRAKAREKGRGSLSILIVAYESGEPERSGDRLAAGQPRRGERSESNRPEGARE